MRIAICISGHFRSLNSHIQNLKNNILSDLNNTYDIFIHTWDTIDRNSSKLDPQLLLQYNAKKTIVEPQIRFPISAIMTKYNYDNRDINGVISMFYKINACNNLKCEYEKENNFIYDCVIRYRADVELLEVLCMNNIDLLKLNIPEHGDYGGINDQFALGNSNIMDKYSSTYLHIADYLNIGIKFNPEFFVHATVKKYNLDMNRISTDYFVKWVNGSMWNNKTRFA